MKTNESSNCGPGCDCGKPSGNNKLKTLICIVVLLAAVSIFAYKAKNGKQTTDLNTTTAFAAPVTSTASEQIPAASATVKDDLTANTVQEKEIVEPPAPTLPATSMVEEKKNVGDYLDSLVSLNKVAVNQDAVFVFIPAKGSNLASKETTDAIASAMQKIQANKVKIGLYTLRSGSPEYANIAAQLPLPGMLVMRKGLGMGAVPAQITETKILQAFVASAQAGCGPSGCGPSSSGCGPAPVGPRVR